MKSDYSNIKRSIILIWLMIFAFSPLFVEGMIYIAFWVAEKPIPERLSLIIKITGTIFFLTVLANILFGFNFKRK